MRRSDCVTHSVAYVHLSGRGNECLLVTCRVPSFVHDNKVRVCAVVMGASGVR